jgi:hypothetical protein
MRAFIARSVVDPASSTSVDMQAAVRAAVRRMPDPLKGRLSSRASDPI